ncbi:MFS transporter [Methanobrevibacter sp.]
MKLGLKSTPHFSKKDLIVIVIAALTQFTTSFVGSMTQVALPLISNDLHLTVELANWIIIAFMIALIAVSIPLSRVISQYGVKKFTIYGIMLLIVGLVMSAVSLDIYFLIISRIIQGIGVGILLISVYMFVVNQISENNLGKALGIVGSGGYIGMTSAPTISGFIVYYTSWRILFIVLILVFAIDLLLLFRFDGEYKSEPKPINIKGSFIYILIMTVFMLGLNKITSWGIYLLIFAIIALAIFIKTEKSSSNAIFNFHLFRDVKHVIGNYAGFVTYFITFITTYILNFHLQYVLGYDTRITGLILLITPVVMVLISPTGGKLADKYDNRIQAGIAMIILFFATFSFCFIDMLPLYALIAVMAVHGIGHGLFSPPNNKFVLTSVDKDHLGDATSMLTTSKELGRAVSLAIYNVICLTIIGNQAISSSTVGKLITSSHIIMAISAVLALSSAALLFYSKFRYDD